MKYQPHHQVSKWKLSELEPVGFRNTNTKVRIAAEAHIEPEGKAAGKIKFQDNGPYNGRSLSFKQSSQALITANRMKRRGTVFIQKQKSAKKIEPSLGFSTFFSILSVPESLNPFAVKFANSRLASSTLLAFRPFCRVISNRVKVIFYTVYPEFSLNTVSFFTA